MEMFRSQDIKRKRTQLRAWHVNFVTEHVFYPLTARYWFNAVW